jgi:dipeptidyl aminopeptidase/acylaminoacyl peptidase
MVKTTKAAIIAAAMMTMMSCAQEKQSQTDSKYIGPSKISVENGVMTPEALLSLGRLSDPQLSPDKNWILYGVSYTSIEENRSCRNLFLTPVTAGEDGRLSFGDKIQLTAEGQSVSNARWSLDGKSIYYLQGGQLYNAAVNIADGKASLSDKKCLSDVAEGIGEFSLSPDHGQILYTSTVPGAVKTPKDFDPKLDKAQAYVAEDLMHRHWDHWTTTRPQTFFAAIGGEKGITAENSLNILDDGAGKYELPLEPFGGIEQVCWSPDGRYVAYSCKKVETGREYAFSTDTEIYIYCFLTGETVQVTMGGGYDTDPVWSPDGKHLAWLSMARNGYEADKVRLMVADIAETPKDEDGQSAIPPVSNIRDLTATFAYNAAGPVWADDSKSLYFNSLTEGLQAIYNVSLPTDETTCGTSDIVRVTPDDAWYDFDSPFAVIDSTLLASYCSMEFPKELVAVSRPDGSFSRITDENGDIIGQLSAYETRGRWIKTTDGKKMLTWVLYPPKFDSTKVYPAIEIFLGGPQGTLSQGWSYRWNYRLMANQGYVVILPNRRGTTAFGQEWCEQISGDYVGQNMQDYLSAAKEMKKEPYIGKLAACGASYGGFSVYYMAGIHGDVYDCFIAHAGIFDEKYMYYETEEMWFPNFDNGGLSEYSYTAGEMGPRGDGKTFGGIQQAGSPWSSAAKAKRHYANSPAVNVTKWHTPILCIHGMMDYRIPYDQGMAAFNAAQMMGVPSKLIVFPEENHWILQPQNALFWHRSFFEWLDRWCKDAEE